MGTVKVFMWRKFSVPIKIDLFKIFEDTSMIKFIYILCNVFLNQTNVKMLSRDNSYITSYF